MQDTRSIGTDLDARTDLAQRLRTLIDMNIRARTQQRQRRGDTADTATYDRYGEFIAIHARVCSFRPPSSGQSGCRRLAPDRRESADLLAGTSRFPRCDNDPQDL
jgi:hypothetical protein